MNGATGTESVRRPLTAWELGTLLVPMHQYRRSRKKAGTERKHFLPILTFVYRNRFALASQIQQRFGRALRSDRTTRRHLAEMESLGYLSVVATQSVSPLWPKVYYVTRRGAARLRKALADQGKPGYVIRLDRSRATGYSADHVLHEVWITEFLLALWQTIQGRPDLELLTVQRRSLAKHQAFQVTIHGRRSRLVPDATFLFRQAGRGMCCCFLELDNGTMNRKQIRAKYGRYAAWYQSAGGQGYLIDLYRHHGARDPRPTFRLLVVTRSRTGKNDDRRMRELYAPIEKLPKVLQDRMWFTTVSHLSRLRDDPSPLEGAIWYRWLKVHRPREKSDTDDGLLTNKQILRPEVIATKLHKLLPEP